MTEKASRSRQTARCCSSARQQGRGACHLHGTHALTQTLPIEGAPREENQLHRVRASPHGRYVCASSHVDNFAIYEVGAVKQIGGFVTPQAPMGFGFDGHGRHGYSCCHDAAVTLEFELAGGHITGQFKTATGCEFIVSY
jgi:hypothetical protein